MTAGWWRHKKNRGHLMQSMLTAQDRLMSRCGRFIIHKPSRELPLLLPSGWIACKDCTKPVEESSCAKCGIRGCDGGCVEVLRDAMEGHL